MKLNVHHLLGCFCAALLLFLEAPLVSAQEVSRDQVVLDARDWWDVYCVYQRFGRKADGVVAGAFTEKVSLLLADKWESLNELREIGSKDRQFIRFVIRHVNSAVPFDRGKKIRENAIKNCSPKENKQLCQNIVQALDQASKAPARSGNPTR